MRGVNLLIDTNVISLCVIANVIAVETEVSKNRLALWQTKPRPDPTKEAEILALASLCESARSGLLQFWTNIGVIAEAWRGRGWPKQTEYSLLRGIALRHAETAISYRNLPMELNDLQAAKRSVEHLLNAQSVSESIISQDNHRKLKSICRSLHPNHYPDAAILLDAEHNQLDYFMTTDKKFRNALRSNKHLEIQCQALSPKEICRSLGLKQTAELPFDFGQRYLLNGIKYD